MSKLEIMPTVLGGDGGNFESFAHDVRNATSPHFFITEDHKYGALRRFIPSKVNWSDPSTMLYDKNGKFDYLVLVPDWNGRRDHDNGYPECGTYYWTEQKEEAEASAYSCKLSDSCKDQSSTLLQMNINRANLHLESSTPHKYFLSSTVYRNTEGIDIAGNSMYVMSKEFRRMFTIDLDSNQYCSESSMHGSFYGGQDQVIKLLDDDAEAALYFTEEGAYGGIHGRMTDGRYFTILEGTVEGEETTGLAFSPDNKHMYFAFQEEGRLMDVTRKDGLPFSGQEVNIKYHYMPK